MIRRVLIYGGGDWAHHAHKLLVFAIDLWVVLMLGHTADLRDLAGEFHRHRPAYQLLLIHLLRVTILVGFNLRCRRLEVGGFRRAALGLPLQSELGAVPGLFDRGCLALVED